VVAHLVLMESINMRTMDTSLATRFLATELSTKVMLALANVPLDTTAIFTIVRAPSAGVPSVLRELGLKQETERVVHMSCVLITMDIQAKMALVNALLDSLARPFFVMVNLRDVNLAPLVSPRLLEPTSNVRKLIAVVPDMNQGITTNVSVLPVTTEQRLETGNILADALSVHTANISKQVTGMLHARSTNVMELVGIRALMATALVKLVTLEL
jgi:hypothetical protein